MSKNDAAVVCVLIVAEPKTLQLGADVHIPRPLLQAEIMTVKFYRLKFKPGGWAMLIELFVQEPSSFSRRRWFSQAKW